MPMKKPADNLKYIFSLSLITAFLLGCSAGESVYYELPYELRDPQFKSEFISKYSPYIKGKKIFIDPGHGGEDRRSVGPQKLVVEADINLQVALALRDFLIEAGVNVILSRTKDETVDLRYRSVAANNSNADIFVSIHHNAPGKEGDNWTNYTSTYYHAKETDYEYEPSERNLAKYIQRDLSYAMRNPGGLGSFDGTYSDYFIYPGAGFSVLRLTEIPSVLVECGFFTHLHEERRLAIEDFNRIEAWGIFRGLCRYFAAGIPEIELLNEKKTNPTGSLALSFSIKDSLGINPSSIRVYFDSLQTSNFSFNEISNILDVNLDGVEEGDHVIRVIAQNKNGNHSFPFHKKITAR